jgi:pyruvate kinase
VTVRAIVTAPPYADFLDEVAAHPLVDGLRLNTVMPVTDRGEALDRLGAFGKPVWVDLKGRQLRVVEPAIPPYTAVRVSHRVRVPVPCDAFFGDGREHARLVAVDGDRLILADGPRRMIGPGESVNVVHPDLVVEGTLTDEDRAWLAVMAERGVRTAMLSYVESPADAAEVRALGAEPILKIETTRGLAFARTHRSAHGRLMAARGDLYVEVRRPHRIVPALRTIVEADPDAIVASRLFDSLAFGAVPESADVTDAAFLLALGYRTFLLGDQVCLKRDSVIAALNLLQAIAA